MLFYNGVRSNIMDKINKVGLAFCGVSRWVYSKWVIRILKGNDSNDGY